MYLPTLGIVLLWSLSLYIDLIGFWCMSKVKEHGSVTLLDETKHAASHIHITQLFVICDKYFGFIL